MATGSEAVSYVLEKAQKGGLLEVCRILDLSVQDLHNEVESFDEESGIPELVKVLENCSNVYLTCEHLTQEKVKIDEQASKIYSCCLIILQKLSVHNQKKNVESKELQKVAINTIRNVFTAVSSKLKEDLILQCIDSLKKYSEDRQFSYGEGSGEPGGQTHYVSLDVDTALHLLRNVLSIPDGNIPEELYEKLSAATCESLVHVDDHMCAKIIGTVIPRMFENMSKNARDKLIFDIWSMIDDLFDKFGQKTFRTRCVHPLSERPLMLLCGLADWMFPLDDVMNLEHPVVTQPSFWVILQSGFFHNSPLSRKRALYLLKRILDTIEQQRAPMHCLPPGGAAQTGSTVEPIFWWNPQHATELSSVWESFILLIESIAEKQVRLWFPFENLLSIISYDVFFFSFLF